MKSRCGRVVGAVERKGDYAVIVKRITPGMVWEMTWMLRIYPYIQNGINFIFLQSLLDSIIVIGIICLYNWRYRPCHDANPTRR